MKKTREETAYERAQILNPLMGPAMDPALRTLKIEAIAQDEGLSPRTIRRWLKAYEEQGFNGLVPATKSSNKTGSVTESILDEAVMLRREAPNRSVHDIIRILELEGKVAKGALKRSTLQDHLSRRGYATHQLKAFNTGAQGSAGAMRRFQRKHRNDLWQTDLKYLLVLPKTATRKATHLYVVVFIDDATRYDTGIGVYEDQTADRVMSCYRRAVERFGVPAGVYTDNGSQFIGRQINQASVKLGVKLVRAKAYSPSSKGKVEAFNKLLDKFVLEMKLEHPQSVEEVQHMLDLWLESYYHEKIHSSIGMSPKQAYQGDLKQQRFVSQEELNLAFTLTETRVVDATGCISYHSRKWEAGVDVIGFKVQVAYRVGNPDELVMYHDSIEPRVIRPLVVSEFVKVRVKPDPLVEAPRSRMLQAMENKKVEPPREGATSYRDLMKENEDE